MPTEVYECVVSGVCAGQFVQNVFHLSVEISSGTPSPWDVANQINAKIGQANEMIDLLMNCLPSSYSCTSVRTRRVGPTGGPTAIALQASLAVFQGQRDPEISSLQANPLIIWIPTTEPSKTGRQFLPGVAEEDIADMQLVQGLIDAIGAFIGKMSEVVAVNGTTDMIGCVFRRASKTGDIFDTGYVSPLIGTQRRRLHPI